MTINEVLTAYNGVLKAKNNEYDYLRRVVFNAARLQAFYVYNANVKHPVSRPEDLMSFEWERSKLIKPTDDEWEKYDKIFPKQI